MRRIGILGGSYNPGHLGHRHIAEQAYEHVGLDEVWLWVSHNIFKDAADYASSEDREDLCNIMCAEFPWLKVTSMEKNFYDTMTATSMTILSALHPKTQFTWIFGDDNFATFHNWNRQMFRVDGKIVPDWQYIMDKFPIAIMYRPGGQEGSKTTYRDDAINSVAAKHGANKQETDPKNLGRDAIGWTFINNDSMTLSSTAVKKSLAAGERQIEGLHPDAEKAIYDRGLFGTNDQSSNNEFKKNNDVRFQTFLLLAAVSHVAKSAASYNFSSPDLTSYIDHFQASWDHAKVQGEFNKADKISGKLADCLISLYRLAGHQGVEFTALNGAKETPKTVTDWHNTSGGANDLQDHIFHSIESLAHICAAEGMERQRGLNLLNIAFSAPDLANPAFAHKTNLEVIEQYANSMAINLSDTLDQRMESVRQSANENQQTPIARQKAQPRIK